MTGRNLTPLEFFFLLLLMGVIWFYARLVRRAREARRLRLLAAWCHIQGLRFDPWRDDSLRGRYQNFDCLRKGYNPHSINVMRGCWQGRYAFTGLDQAYWISHKDSGSPQVFSAVILESPHPLPPLRIRRAFRLFRGHFPSGPVSLENMEEEFLRLYAIDSHDKTQALDCLFPEVMRFLLAHPLRLTIQFDRHSVIAYGGSEFTPEEFVHAADLLTGILDLLAPERASGNSARRSK